MQKWARICCRCWDQEPQGYDPITWLLLNCYFLHHLILIYEASFKRPTKPCSLLSPTSFYYHNLGLATFQGPNSIKEIHAYKASIFSSCQKSNLLHHWSPMLMLYLNIFYQPDKGLNCSLQPWHARSKEPWNAKSLHISRFFPD